MYLQGSAARSVNTVAVTVEFHGENELAISLTLPGYFASHQVGSMRIQMKKNRNNQQKKSPFHPLSPALLNNDSFHQLPVFYRKGNDVNP